jgi:hypothetical protein
VSKATRSLGLVISVAILGGLGCRRSANESTPPATAAVSDLPRCYPYAEHDGVCIESCDPTLGVPYSQSHPDCARDGWPLLCNEQRECYPVPTEDHPSE